MMTKWENRERIRALEEIKVYEIADAMTGVKVRDFGRVDYAMTVPPGYYVTRHQTVIAYPGDSFAVQGDHRSLSAFTLADEPTDSEPTTEPPTLAHEVQLCTDLLAAIGRIDDTDGILAELIAAVSDELLVICARIESGAL